MRPSLAAAAADDDIDDAEPRLMTDRMEKSFALALEKQ